MKFLEKFIYPKGTTFINIANEDLTAIVEITKEDGTFYTIGDVYVVSLFNHSDCMLDTDFENINNSKTISELKSNINKSCSIMHINKIHSNSKNFPSIKISFNNFIHKLLSKKIC